MFYRLALLAPVGAAVLALSSIPAMAVTPAYTLGGPAASVSSGSGDWNWENGFYLQDFRLAVENSANFGPGGTVSVDINTVNLTTFDSTSLAGVNGVIVPWWYESDAPSGAIDALKTFFLGGGDLFLLDDDSDTDGVAQALGIPTFSYSSGSASNGGAPLFDGPFGLASDITQNGTTGQLSAADVASHGGTVAALNADNEVTGAVWDYGQYAPGAGRLIILADVDMISSNYGAATYSPLNDQGRFALNAVAFLVGEGKIQPPPTSIPLPAAAWMGLSLMGGLAGVRKLRSRKEC